MLNCLVKPYLSTAIIPTNLDTVNAGVQIDIKQSGQRTQWKYYLLGLILLFTAGCDGLNQCIDANDYGSSTESSISLSPYASEGIRIDTKENTVEASCVRGESNECIENSQPKEGTNCFGAASASINIDTSKLTLPAPDTADYQTKQTLIEGITKEVLNFGVKIADFPAGLYNSQQISLFNSCMNTRMGTIKNSDRMQAQAKRIIENSNGSTLDDENKGLLYKEFKTAVEFALSTEEKTDASDPVLGIIQECGNLMNKKQSLSWSILGGSMMDGSAFAVSFPQREDAMDVFMMQANGKITFGKTNDYLKVDTDNNSIFLQTGYIPMKKEGTSGTENKLTFLDLMNGGATSVQREKLFSVQKNDPINIQIAGQFYSFDSVMTTAQSAVNKTYGNDFLRRFVIYSLSMDDAGFSANNPSCTGDEKIEYPDGVHTYYVPNSCQNGSFIGSNVQSAFSILRTYLKPLPIQNPINLKCEELIVTSSDSNTCRYLSYSNGTAQNGFISFSFANDGKTTFKNLLEKGTQEFTSLNNFLSIDRSFGGLQNADAVNVEFFLVDKEFMINGEKIESISDSHKNTSIQLKIKVTPSKAAVDNMVTYQIEDALSFSTSSNTAGISKNRIVIHKDDIVTLSASITDLTKKVTLNVKNSNLTYEVPLRNLIVVRVSPVLSFKAPKSGYLQFFRAGNSSSTTTTDNCTHEFYLHNLDGSYEGQRASNTEKANYTLKMEAKQWSPIVTNSSIDENLVFVRKNQTVEFTLENFEFNVDTTNSNIVLPTKTWTRLSSGSTVTTLESMCLDGLAYRIIERPALFCYSNVKQSIEQVDGEGKEASAAAKKKCEEKKDEEIKTSVKNCIEGSVSDPTNPTVVKDITTIQNIIIGLKDVVKENSTLKQYETTYSSCISSAKTIASTKLAMCGLQMNEMVSFYKNCFDLENYTSSTLNIEDMLEWAEQSAGITTEKVINAVGTKANLALVPTLKEDATYGTLPLDFHNGTDSFVMPNTTDTRISSLSFPNTVFPVDSNSKLFFLVLLDHTNKIGRDSLKQQDIFATNSSGYTNTRNTTDQSYYQLMIGIADESKTARNGMYTSAFVCDGVSGECESMIAKGIETDFLKEFPNNCLSDYKEGDTYDSVKSQNGCLGYFRSEDGYFVMKSGNNSSSSEKLSPFSLVSRLIPNKSELNKQCDPAEPNNIAGLTCAEIHDKNATNSQGKTLFETFCKPYGFLESSTVQPCKRRFKVLLRIKETNVTGCSDSEIRESGLAQYLCTKITRGGTPYVINRYSDNDGAYTVSSKFEQENDTSSTVLVDIIDFVHKQLFGSKEGSEIQAIQSMYNSIINASFYRILFKTCAALALMMFGYNMLLGMGKIKTDELLYLFFKIGFILLLIGGGGGMKGGGWGFYNNYFVRLFVNGVNGILFRIVAAINGQGNAEIPATNGAVLNIVVKEIDSVFALILTNQGLAKFIALLFSGFFGFVYFYIIGRYVFLQYGLVIFGSIGTFISAQILMIITLAIGPLFFIFLLFKSTQDSFNSWLNSLIGLAFTQITFIIIISIFNKLLKVILMSILSYKVCKEVIFALSLPIVGRVPIIISWRVAGYNSDYFTYAKNFPSLFNCLFAFMVLSLMEKFLKDVEGLSSTLFGISKGGISTGSAGMQLDEVAKAGIGAVTSVAGSSFKMIGNTAMGRAFGEWAKEKYANAVDTVTDKIDNSFLGTIDFRGRQEVEEQILEERKVNNAVRNLAIEEERVRNDVWSDENIERVDTELLKDWNWKPPEDKQNYSEEELAELKEKAHASALNAALDKDFHGRLKEDKKYKKRLETAKSADLKKLGHRGTDLKKRQDALEKGNLKEAFANTGLGNLMGRQLSDKVTNSTQRRALKIFSAPLGMSAGLHAVGGAGSKDDDNYKSARLDAAKNLHNKQFGDNTIKHRMDPAKFQTNATDRMEQSNKILNSSDNLQKFEEEKYKELGISPQAQEARLANLSAFNEDVAADYTLNSKDKEDIATESFANEIYTDNQRGKDNDQIKANYKELIVSQVNQNDIDSATLVRSALQACGCTGAENIKNNAELTKALNSDKAYSQLTSGLKPETKAIADQIRKEFQEANRKMIDDLSKAKGIKNSSKDDTEKIKSLEAVNRESNKNLLDLNKKLQDALAKNATLQNNYQKNKISNFAKSSPAKSYESVHKIKNGHVSGTRGDDTKVHVKITRPA